MVAPIPPRQGGATPIFGLPGTEGADLRCIPATPMENKGAVMTSIGKLTPTAPSEIDYSRPRNDKKGGCAGVPKVEILLIASLTP